jgi:hypothetical protein
MKWEVLHLKLMNAARNHPPSAAVPLGFETRIMARLKNRLAGDPWTAWAMALWRAAALSLVAMTLCGAWFYFSGNGLNTNFSLADDFENTVLAAIGPSGENW